MQSALGCHWLPLVVACIIVGVFIFSQSGLQQISDRNKHLVADINQSGDRLKQLTTNFLRTSNGAGTLASATSGEQVRDKHQQIKALKPQFEAITGDLAEQVIQRTRTVESVSQKTLAEARESARYCREVDDLSKSLSELVARFRVVE